MIFKTKEAISLLTNSRVNKNAGVKERNKFGENFALLLEPLDKDAKRPSRTIVLNEKFIEHLKDVQGNIYFSAFREKTGEIKVGFATKEQYDAYVTDGGSKTDLKKLAKNWTFASTMFYEQFFQKACGYNEGDIIEFSKEQDENGNIYFQVITEDVEDESNEEAYEPHLDNSVDITSDSFPANVREDSFSNH